MFDANKMQMIIEHVSSRLESFEKYTIACDLEDAELVQLREHFVVTVEDGFGDFDHMYTFKKK